MAVGDALVDNGLLGKGVRSVLLAVAITYAVSWMNWGFTSWQSSRAVAAAKRAGPGDLKSPPTLPSAVPVVGHIFQFILGGHEFMSSAAKHYGLGVPVRINLATFPSYLVSGRDCVAAFLKDQGRQLSRIPRGLSYMEHAFGCPHEFVHQFKPRDDVEIEHQMHTALQTMLAGQGLEVLAGRYQTEVASGALSTSLVSKGDDWTELPDLCSFVENHVLEAATRALYGPHLVALNPTLAQDFWDFNRRVKSMFMGVPKWLNPSAVRARDKMTDNVKRWQRYAAEHCHVDDIPDHAEWEPFYGSRYTRVRQKLLTKRDIMDESARAAENLAFIWATNANSVPSAIWFLLETLNNPALEKQVRSRLQAARAEPTGENPLAFDVAKLTSDSLLQSMFAEILRLRVAALVVRQPTDPKGFSLPGGWHIKPKQTISMSTRTELMDPAVWNAGDAANPHPLDRFWAERFLVYPEDRRSGPLREPKRRFGAAATGEPYFSLDGCTWNWVPFGGGRQLCPGRHFAKCEILLTSAIFLSAFEIELLTDKLPGPDEGVYGFGTMPPNGKVPCRIRRRKGNAVA